MTAPVPPGKKRKGAGFVAGPKPKVKPVLEELTEGELATEAYGKKGVGLRKGLATIGRAHADSTLGQKVAGRVKSFLRRTQGK